jgi:chemotaxis protein methyltransferase CheR
MRLITEKLSSLTGFSFTDLAPIAFKRTVLNAMNLLYVSSPDNLFSRLQDKEFLIKFLEKLIVPGTEFFRDASVWSALQEILQNESPKKKFSVLITGVSNATELYSFLILLKEIDRLDDFTIDVSSVLIEDERFIRSMAFDKKMMEVSMNNYAMYNTNGDVLRYFIENDGAWIYDTNLIENVNKFYSNEALKSLSENSYDIIWSRNQLIYWGDRAKINFFGQLNRLLKNNGSIGIGVKEQIPMSFKGNYIEISEGNKLYKKIGS